MCTRHHTHCSGFRGPGAPSRWSDKCYSETPTAQHVIYNIKRAVWNSCSPAKTPQQYVPWSSSFPPPTPRRKKPIHNLPKTPPHQISHHQCAAPGIDPIVSPHPRIQCSGPLQKDSHPEPANDRVYTRRGRESYRSAGAVSSTGSPQSQSQSDRRCCDCDNNVFW
jgi:hypothetical protein